MQLGFLPSKRVQYTASHEKGQIYIPVVNRLVAAGTLGAVITFGALGGAYGIAVSMLNTCREPAGGRWHARGRDHIRCARGRLRHRRLDAKYLS